MLLTIPKEDAGAVAAQEFSGRLGDTFEQGLNFALASHGAGDVENSPEMGDALGSLLEGLKLPLQLIEDAPDGQAFGEMLGRQPRAFEQ
jgi:hypothetical protein